jgi:hypothetical protein
MLSSTVLRFDALTRIQSLNVTVGTGIPYSFGVWGDNLDSSISYDNGALIHDEVTYTADGEFLFTLTEDVAMTTNFSLSTQRAGTSPYTLYLDIDLQTGVGGELFIGSIPISFVERIGWTWDGFDSYDTPPGNPTVDITVINCEHVYANLLD